MEQGLYQAIRKSLIKHEGYERKPYICTAGKITIGVGRNLSDRGIDDALIETWLEQDICSNYAELQRKLPFFDQLDEARKLVLVDMSFMGVQKLLGFKRMLAALERKDWHIAANELMSSKWATQVGNRAIELFKIMKEGKL